LALAQAAHEDGTILGAKGLELLDLPDNRLDSLERLALIKQIEKWIALYHPQLVYVHHAGDVNIDHLRLHESMVTACLPTHGQPVRLLLSFELALSTEWQPTGSAPTFQPNCFAAIASNLKHIRLGRLKFNINHALFILIP
jgi:LmbE family N-acetylglucosaminyl deacetylase